MRIIDWSIIAYVVMFVALYGGCHYAYWASVTSVFLFGMAVILMVSRHAKNRLWSYVGQHKLFLGACLGSIAILILLQTAPLPLSWLSRLSPIRASWLRAAHEVAGLDAPWSSVSYQPVATVFAGLMGALLVLVAFVVYRRTREDPAVSVTYMHVFWALALAEALYGLAQVFVPSLGALWDASGSYAGFARGTYVNHNHYAALLSMLLPVCLAVILIRHERAPAQTPLLVFGAALIGVSLLLSMSRAGILAGFLSLLLFAGLLYPRYGRTLKYLLMGFGTLVLVYGGAIAGDLLCVRYERLNADLRRRIDLYRDTWTLIRDHFWTGTGLGTFSDVFRLYQHAPAAHAHNDYLEWIAQVGVPVGVMSIAALWGLWGYATVRVWRASRCTTTDSPPLACVTTSAALSAALLSLGVHCAVDFPAQMLGNAAVCALFTAMLFGLLSQK